MSSFHAATLETLSSQYTCHALWKADDPDALIGRIADEVTVVVTSGSRGITRDVIDRLPHLKLIACFGVGVDAIDVGYAKSRGIVVTNTPDVLVDDVADLALGLTLATVREMCVNDAYVREGRWTDKPYGLTASFQGRRVGIVGLGRIGHAIARRCEAFNAAISWTGPRAKPDAPYPYVADIVELARDVDVLIAACPGGPATQGIVSREVLDALGTRGIFINISRGSVVDEAALIDALRSGRIAGAGLDVFHNEPAIDPAFAHLPNVVLQAHMGSATHRTRALMGELVVRNVDAFLQGKGAVTPV
ncbi:2-hydroxyacid dehydrogenase [Pararobbsia alpina]|uniref:2-hydroxyacid dehydrogenase n=1 Tax=Pararobbsia alpina TaxID=621374 RepID=UPI0039A722CE